MRLNVEAPDAGKRLDHYLQEKLPQYSRARLQEWIKAGRVTVEGGVSKSSFLLRGAEEISVEPAQAPPLHAYAEDIPIDVIYEDADVIAVNKPAGLVVHAGAGCHSGTLVNALLHRFGALADAGGAERPGIVHRIDRDTSGVLLVARNDAAHRALAAQFALRQVGKVYLALVQGSVRQDQGTIQSPIARDPIHRRRMTTRLDSGRTALTTYRVLKRYPRHSYLEVTIGTGRTHQIRVHLSSIGHAVAGDTLYGAAPDGRERFFLHAKRIVFTSPSTNERITVEAPLPGELEGWLRSL